MKTLCITGGRPLSGEIRISGSKNAALPILFATLLIREPVLLENIPDIRDTALAIDLLSGFSVKTCAHGGGTYAIDAKRAAPGAGELSPARSMRGSIYLLGASLARFGEARLPLPGGCDFGSRPIDCHLALLRQMGAEICEEDGYLTAKASRLRGITFRFPIISVGATVNAILAATAAEGETVLIGAAEEPHVFDLVAFLRAAGARIASPDRGVLVIDGGARLHGCRHRITPDMIEAGTYLLAVAAAGGDAYLRGADIGHLGAEVDLLRKVGISVSGNPAGIRVLRCGRISGADFETAPYPGFPTDLQPQTVALLALADGESRVTETVWADRFRYAGELRKMGADLKECGRTLLCRGVPRLRGARMTIPDLRAGAALAIAALAAEGDSLLENATLIERGYENFCKKMATLGARISVCGEV